MLDLLKLMATLGLDASEYEKGLDDAESSANSFGSKLKSGLATAGKVAMGAVTAASGAVVAFGTASVRAGMEFDASMSQVGATMGKTADELTAEVGAVDTEYGHFEGTLRDFAQYMGSNTVFSATQAAQALNYMALAGYNTQESMEMLPNVLNLAAAGGMDLAMASDMITDSQTALGISMSDTNKLVDQMAKMASTTNTSVSQLGDAILTVGSTAQFMSGGTEELTSVLGVLADSGIKGSEAGTHLRNMLLKLSSPTTEGAAALEALGVAVFDDAGDMRNLIDVFGDLQGAMGNLTKEEQLTMLSDIFNARDVAAATALMGTSVDRWDQLAGALEDASGAAQQMAKTQLDNLSGDITLFQSALEGAKIAVSDELTPTIREFVSFGSEGLSRLTTAFKSGGIDAAFTEFGSILSDGVSLIIDKLSTIIDLGGKLLGAFVSGLIDNAPKIIDAGITIINKLVKTIGNPESIRKTVGAVTTLITTIGNSISGALPELIPAFVSIIVELAKTLTDPDSITQIIDTAITIMDALLGGILGALPTILGAIPDIIVNITMAVIRNLPKLLAKIPEILVKIVGAVIENLPTLIGMIPTIISELVKAFFDPENMKQILGIGKQLVEGMWNGIKDAGAWLWEKISGFFGGILDKIKNFFGIKSPSKVFAGIGEMLDRGLAKGISDYAGLAEDAADDLADSVYSSMDDLSGPTFENGIFDISSKSGNALTGAGNSVIINVYGAVGQDVSELAEIVSQKIAFNYDVERRAFA